MSPAILDRVLVTEVPSAGWICIGDVGDPVEPLLQREHQAALPSSPALGTLRCCALASTSARSRGSG